MFDLCVDVMQVVPVYAGQEMSFFANSSLQILMRVHSLTTWALAVVLQEDGATVTPVSSPSSRPQRSRRAAGAHLSIK